MSLMAEAVRTGAATPAKRRSGERQLGEVIVLLRAAIRAVQLYPADNAAVVKVVAELAAACERVAVAEGMFELRSAGDHLFINDARLRLGVDTMAAVGAVIAVMRDAGVGTVTLQARPSHRDWTGLLVAMVRVPEGVAESDRLARLTAQLEQAGALAFALGPPLTRTDDPDTEVEGRERSRQTYLRAVSATRDIFQHARVGGAVGVRQARRVLRGVVDEILRDEASMLGLTALRDFDEYTFVHSVNVCILAVSLGRRLGLSKPQLLELGLAALLHDVGKSQVPLEVLNKPGRLTEAEFALVREHTWRGALALVRMPFGMGRPWRAMAVAFEHHLRVDLSGYPRARRSRQVTLLTRIVAVADGFDAATSRRVYQDVPWSPADVLRGMQDTARHGLDPVVVKAFTLMMGTYPVGTVVVLDSGEVGVVTAANPDPALCARPRVRLVLDPSGLRIDGEVMVDLGMRARDGEFLRSVVRTDSPERYGISIGDYTG